ncbi:MAG TPA: carbonic anhydrase [Leptolyngbyaceae cyanobacterium]
MNSQTPSSRRHFLKLGAAGAFGIAATAGDFLGRVDPAWAEAQPSLTPTDALRRLMEGNQRFILQQPQHPDQSQKRLHEVAQSQHPFATILSCADSRVPAELVFDQGIGALFDVRIAGNIAVPEALGSIEYAVALLGTPVLMVMGHERCGAVTAAVQNEVLPGDISTFVKAILPAVDRVKGDPGDLVDNAVTANVKYQIEQLMRSQILRERVQSGQLRVVGGRYDLDTGRVTLLT